MIKAIDVTSHNKMPSSLIFGYEYDSLQLVAAAAKKANSVSPTALAAALQTLKPGSAKTGVFPSYFFNKTSHAPNIPPAAFDFAAPSLLVNGQYARLVQRAEQSGASVTAGAVVSADDCRQHGPCVVFAPRRLETERGDPVRVVEPVEGGS